jgi:hypothetical protein
MDKFDATRFTDAALKQAGKVYMTGEDMKAMGKKRKQEEEQFKFLKKQGEANVMSKAMNDAMAFHKLQHPEKYKTENVQRIIYGPEGKETGKKEVDVTTRYEGLVGKGGAGAKTQSLADIQKTYRKDFIHEESQKWFNDVSQAVENSDWDTFMALGKDIPELETRISQGIAGTSEVVRSQISSATAFWSTIREQLTPELYKMPGAETKPDITGGAGIGIGAQVPEGLEAEVHAAQDLFDSGKTEEASAKLNELIKTHSQELIDSLMR